jgi:hypothetical protein
LNRLFKLVVCLLLVLGATQSAFAADNFQRTQSANLTNIGTGLLIGGGILTAVGSANGFENGGSASFYSGIAVLGAGTGMLLWGHSKRGYELRDSLEAAQSRSFVVGVSLLRNGGAAGAVLRW